MANIGILKDINLDMRDLNKINSLHIFIVRYTTILRSIFVYKMFHLYLSEIKLRSANI